MQSPDITRALSDNMVNVSIDRGCHLTWYHLPGQGMGPHSRNPFLIDAMPTVIAVFL